jgi:hypothetical protein
VVNSAAVHQVRRHRRGRRVMAHPLMHGRGNTKYGSKIVWSLGPADKIDPMEGYTECVNMHGLISCRGRPKVN